MWTSKDAVMFSHRKFRVPGIDEFRFELVGLRGELFEQRDRDV